MEGKLQIELFGPAQLRRNGNRVTGFESRKALALLGYLAEQERYVTRSQLADLFWGDKSEARGRGNLSRVLHNLTGLLPGCLEISRETIRFCRNTGIYVDVAEFARLDGETDLEAWIVAVDLYRGEFMDGMYLNDCPAFESWLEAEQQLWRQKLAYVYIKIIDCYRSRGDLQNSLLFSRRWLELDPWREETHRQVMVLLAASGQRSAALLQYKTCRRTLAEQLGVNPSLETESLYKRIQQGKPVTAILSGQPAWQVYPDLPARPAVEDGLRLAPVLARLEDPACRMLTLLGPDRSACAHLAQQAAQHCAGSYADEVHTILAEAVSADGAFVRACAQATHLALNPNASPDLQLLTHLRDKELLLVVTDLDLCGDALTILVDILKRAPRVKALVTSTRPADVCLEWIVDV